MSSLWSSDRGRDNFSGPGPGWWLVSNWAGARESEGLQPAAHHVEGFHSQTGVWIWKMGLRQVKNEDISSLISMTLQLCKMDSKYLSHGSFYMLPGMTLSRWPDPVDVHPVSVIFPSSSGRIPVSAFCLSPAPMLSLLSACHLVTEALPRPWSRGRSIC